MLGENYEVGPSKRAADGELDYRDGKRRRSGGPEAVFEELLSEGGCELESRQEFLVEDARKLRRLLEQKLTLNAELKNNFLAGLEAALAEGEVLHAALKPLTATGLGAAVTGDSLVRVLLNVAALQKDVARLLLERLPEFCVGSDEEERAVSQLILGQFRWLDHVADSHWLTQKVLEVLPACPQELQRDAVGFLPEIAQEEDHVAVLMSLQELMESDNTFILPVIEAVSNLSLGPDMQGQAVAMVQGRFQSADPQDLPALVRFLLQHTTQALAKGVVEQLRRGLHFVALSDARLAVPDRKGKGKAGSGDNLESQILDSIKQGMQLNPLAADTLIKEIQSIQEPAEHKVLDFWVLLLLHTMGPERRKVAEGLLRKKLAEGHANAGWMEGAISGHEKVMGDFFSTLLSLAQQLVRATNEGVAAAGSSLFVAMFSNFRDTYKQQEVLRALHSHLGAHVPAEADTALEVLGQLSRRHTGELMKYAAFLTNVLDYVDGYSDPQTHQVFAMFSELVAGTCRRQDEMGDGGGRSRMEDELMIFIRKQLGSAHASHRRVGIVGIVTLVQRLGEGLSEGTEGKGAIAKRYGEAMEMLLTSLEECKRSPESFAFLCDQLARGIQEKRVSRRLMMDMQSKVTDMFMESFISDLDGDKGRASVQVGSTKLVGTAWWNLDGDESPVALNMLPFLAEQVAEPTGGPSSTPLVFLFSITRLMGTIGLALSDKLDDMDALLGCPVTLFPMDLATPSQFGAAPAEVQRVVLLGLFYVLNWYRELVNAFAVQLSTSGSRKTEDKAELKLFARLRSICQLEVLLDALLAQAPPLFSLPRLSNTLEGERAGVAPLLPPKKKAPAKKLAAAKGKVKGAAGKQEGKKEVKLGDQANASPGSTKRGSEAPSKSNASGGSQGVAMAATQGASTAASGCLNRLSLERSKFRSLLLPSLNGLAIGGLQQEVFSMLPPACYLLADLHWKLAAVLSKARRPTFLRAPSKAALPADLSPLTPGQLLEAVRPVLPALRRHLDTALRAITEQMSDEDMEQQDHRTVWSNMLAGPTQATAPQGASAFLVQMPGNSPAEAALSPSLAAKRVMTLVLECVKRILTFHEIGKPAHRPTLQALLRAFSSGRGEGEEEEGADWNPSQLLSAIRQAFVYFVEKLPKEQATPTASFEHCHSMILIIDALLALAKKVLDGMPTTKKSVTLPRKMGLRISQSAHDMLKQEWKEKGQEGSGWKGRNAGLGELLRLYVSHYRNRSNQADPLHAIKEITTEHLANVTNTTLGKPNSEPSEDYPSLSGATMAVWYKAALEELQVVWEDTVGKAAETAKSKEYMQDEATVAALVDSLLRCAEAFSSLMGIVKKQEKRAAVHIQAVKSGGKFLESFFRALPFWAAIFEAYSDSALKMVKELQRGTKVIQTLCSEGKYKKDLPLTAKVPQVKRTVERFLFKMNEVLVGAGKHGAFWLGNLKHRNLAGQEVPSQMYADDEVDEQQEEGYEEEEDAGDEVTAESQVGEEEMDED